MIQIVALLFLLVVVLIVVAYLGYRAGYDDGMRDASKNFDNGLEKLSAELWKRKQESDK